MIVSPNHTSITVADMERSIAFYREKLGFSIVNERIAPADFASVITGIRGAELKVVYIEAGGYRIELIQYLQSAGEPTDVSTNRPGSCHIAFNVDDLNAMYEDLVAQGVAFKSPPVTVTGGPNKGNLGIYLTDPDGVVIELIQQVAQA